MYEILLCFFWLWMIILPSAYREFFLLQEYLFTLCFSITTEDYIGKYNTPGWRLNIHIAGANREVVVTLVVIKSNLPCVSSLQERTAPLLLHIIPLTTLCRNRFCPVLFFFFLQPAVWTEGRLQGFKHLDIPTLSSGCLFFISLLSCGRDSGW